MKDKFQTNFDITRLYDANVAFPQVTKVGIVPFVALPALKILAMKPRASAKHLGDPAFQIAKGTRRIFINEAWCDMRDDDLRYADPSFYESLTDTALREGYEEVGLKSGNIVRMFDLGGFTFTSASKGIVKPIHIFAAQIKQTNDFSAFEATTSETRWMTPEEFARDGRDDHANIMQEVVKRLLSAL